MPAAEMEKNGNGLKEVVQLIREDNAYENKSYTWSYDSLGDITGRKTYAYSAGTLGTAVNTVTYSYGNRNWYHQLTAYNGTSLSFAFNADGLRTVKNIGTNT